MNGAHKNRIKLWQQDYVSKGKLAGSSVLVSHKGKEVHFSADGKRNLEQSLAFTRETHVRLYSMTKPITSVAIMILVERGLIQLDMPVSEFIPEFADVTALVTSARSFDQTEPSSSPTIFQLLTHTSGLSYPFNTGILPTAMDVENLSFGPSRENLADLTKRAASFPLAFQPGRRWEYSIGIDILGRVIEVITGQSLDEFFQQEIFEPLGMTDTGFHLDRHVGDRFATLYSPSTRDPFSLTKVELEPNQLCPIDEFETSKFLTTGMLSGGGGLIGTIDDYMMFCEMLRLKGRFRNSQILHPNTVCFMMQNHLSGDIASMGPSSFAEQPMDGMGFGLGGAVMLDPKRARCAGSIGDFSWGGMASTFFWVNPVLDLCVVFFTQLAPSSVYPIRAELKDLVHSAISDL